MNRKITIKRFVSAENFIQMLGLYRAEGLKTSGRVRFTNDDPILHKWFIKSLRQMGVDKFMAYTYYCSCKKCGMKKLGKAVKTFEQITGVKIRGEYYDECAHNLTFHVDVNSKTLATFLKHAE